MPFHCSSLAIKLPHGLGLRRYNESNFTPNHVVSFFMFFHHSKRPHDLSQHIGCLSNFNRISFSSSTMEDQEKLGLFARASSEPEQYFKELDVAVRAVQMACSLCRRVQDSLISKTGAHVQSKDDNSPVTVAGQSIYFFLVSFTFLLNWVSAGNFNHGFCWEIHTLPLSICSANDRVLVHILP